MNKINNYKDLIGLHIIEIKQDEDYFYFITKDNYTIRTPLFVPYCACYVGEYIDEISINGKCTGIITNIEKNIINNSDEITDDYIVYEGNVTFYFEEGKIKFKVHGEDNGYYGVSFTLPVEILEKLNE